MDFIGNIILNIPSTSTRQIYETQKNYTLPNLCNLCGNHPRSLVLAGEAFNSACDEHLMATPSSFLKNCAENTLDGLKRYCL